MFLILSSFFFFFFNDTATTEIYTLSLHDALPISPGPFSVQANVHQATGALVVTVPRRVFKLNPYVLAGAGALMFDPTGSVGGFVFGDRKSTRLNSSHT